MLNRIVRNWITKNLTSFEGGSLKLSFPKISDIVIGDQRTPEFTISFKSFMGIFLILRRGVLGFTEAFIRGYWTTDDLPKKP